MEMVIDCFKLRYLLVSTHQIVLYFRLDCDAFQYKKIKELLIANFASQ